MSTLDKKFDDILSNFDREWNFSRFWFFNGEIHVGYFDFVMWFLNFQLVFNFWCWALYHQTFYRMYIKNNSYINLDDGNYIGIVWSCSNTVKTHNVSYIP